MYFPFRIYPLKAKTLYGAHGRGAYGAFPAIFWAAPAANADDMILT